MHSNVKVLENIQKKTLKNDNSSTRNRNKLKKGAFF
jgi:hypothetical protein